MVALFTFITFTGTPFDKKKKKLNSTESNGYEMKPINGNNNRNIGSDNENNNIRNNEQNSEEAPQPRARLPGILHFMFET